MIMAGFYGALFTHRTFVQYLQGPRTFMGWSRMTRKPPQPGEYLVCIIGKGQEADAPRLAGLLQVTGAPYTATLGSPEDIWNDGDGRHYLEQIPTREDTMLTHLHLNRALPRLIVPRGGMTRFMGRPTVLTDAQADRMGRSLGLAEDQERTLGAVLRAMQAPDVVL